LIGFEVSFASAEPTLGFCAHKRFDFFWRRALANDFVGLEIRAPFAA
jgi:hypothetical protein